MRTTLMAIAIALSAIVSKAQTTDEGTAKNHISPLDGIEITTEAQISASHGNTPLWLNANKFGLSSLESTNGYLRATALRPLAIDSGKTFGVGYGLDVAVPFNYTSHIVVQQAYAEVRWLHGTLSAGSKQHGMELKNNRLSSGSQTLGINARPVPQARLALPDYWTLPFANRWLAIKGHIAYGLMTDQRWQHSFTQKRTKYVDDAYFHSKSGYLRIGSDKHLKQWSLELGLEMSAIYGGTAYAESEDGMTPLLGEKGIRGFLHALIPGGFDAGETVYKNVSGDQVGSWVARLNYDADNYTVSVYTDKFFEDHSAMLFTDYNGYGEGDEWNEKKKSKFLIYKLKDMLLGAEVKLKHSRWVDNIVGEYIYTKYQSGPIFHDHTKNLSDHIGGVDNFYNHHIYTGWQHWGMVMGNPLYRSPIYNDNGRIEVQNNRFMAFHLGMSGQPAPNLDYRLLATWQDGQGTYIKPYVDPKHNVSLMAEANYRFTAGTLRGWSVRAAIGIDRGKIYGNNHGVQITIAKRWR
ncbi:MAG: hypothetical protein IJK21_06440 [Prevotella sp.]|nr:hypothetical protein [Prevotella sp.]